MDGAFSTPRVRLADPIERIGEAAKRLGINVWTLRSRAASLGLTSGRTPGRPKQGEVAGLRRSEWNQCGGSWKRGPKTRRVSRVKRVWTPDEDQRLTDMWGQVDAGEVCASLGRTWSAIVAHAADLCLPTGLPPGLVTLLHASRVLGHDREALLNIARRNDVPVCRHPCPLTKRLGGEVQRWRCVHLDALRVAVEREDRETETVHAAALRRGIPDETLRLWLRKEKVIPAREGPRVVHRVATADIDRVVQARRPSVPTLEMTGEAARRVGVNVSTLQLWLRKAGLRKPTPHGRVPWLDPAVVDAVVARHRAASAGRTRSEGDDDA